jgi:23S rRNA (guanine745-N1)-methyltransferase
VGRGPETLNLGSTGRRTAPALVCTVRGCARELQRAGRRLSCARGHSYDLARSGYVNLLQPQDRRSRRPGDSAEAVRARRRLADRGVDEWLIPEILTEVDRVAAAAPRKIPAVLDVGCGEGSVLSSLANRRAIDAHGIDLSVDAIELAAKRHPASTWVVGNADRMLPWIDGSFDLALSITGPRNGRELRRILAPQGRALVVVPGGDDLAELRAAVLGAAMIKDRAAAAVERLRPHLELLSRRTVRRTAELDADALQDLLAATYRGARRSERARASCLSAMTVTFDREILLFRRG